MEKLTQSDTFSVEQFSSFLTRRSETPDFDGRPLLDTTMSLFGSGMAYGHSHGNANLPLVLAGGTGCGLGSSGIQIRFEVPLILEGFRPGRTVRIRPQNWPNVKPPVEETVRGFQDRWPSPDLFLK